jgi:hypothetical protein
MHATGLGRGRSNLNEMRRALTLPFEPGGADGGVRRPWTDSSGVPRWTEIRAVRWRSGAAPAGFRRRARRDGTALTEQSRQQEDRLRSLGVLAGGIRTTSTTRSCRSRLCRHWRRMRTPQRRDMLDHAESAAMTAGPDHPAAVLREGRRAAAAGHERRPPAPRHRRARRRRLADADQRRQPTTSGTRASTAASSARS